MKKRICAGALAVSLLLSPTVLSSASALAASNSEVGALQAVQALGIINGNSSGDLQLDRAVTRAEFTKMLVAASSYRDSVGTIGNYSPFYDVKSSHWAAPYIKAALEAGWVSGYLDGTFRPQSQIKLEEACSAVLKLLGYDATKLTGSFPAAQLSKASALGLLDNISLKQGATMTRRACVYLFYNLMTADQATGEVYATTLGYTLNQAGELDYAKLIAKDLKGPYTVGSTGLALPFAQPTAIYRDSALITADAVQPYEIYYYNTKLKTVYVYNDRVTGVYTVATPGAAAPTAVTVAGQSYEIESSDAAYKLSTSGTFPLDSIVTLLLGMDGKVADVVDAGIVQADDVSYLAIIEDGLKGPYTASETGTILPLSFTPSAIYREGKQILLSDIQPYEIYYYNAALKTVYVYNDRVTGTYSAATPGTGAPTAVTVAGQSYEIEDPDAAYKLSVSGSLPKNSVVTLLLGKDGKVADVVDASVVQAEDVSYLSIIQDGLKGPYTAGQTGGEAGIAIPFTPDAIYREGEKILASDIQPYEIYYYNAALKTVYVYNDRVTGTYSAATPGTGAPTAVTVAGQSYEIEDPDAAYKLSVSGSLPKDSVVTLLLGKDGKVADVVAASVVQAEDVSYLSIIQDGLKGPYTAGQTGGEAGMAVPFTPDAIYRDGEKILASDIQPYEIYYYNAALKTVYVYNDRVTGTYSAATPGTGAPTAVTVAGQSYEIEDSDAAYKLSTSGTFPKDSVVTLLLGKDGKVADVVGANVAQADEVSVVDIVQDGLKGPYTVPPINSTDSFIRDNLTLPFALEEATIYKNGKLSSSAAIETYDIYYYNASMKLVYLYDKRESGIYTAASPGIVSPESVTVGGNTYTVGTTDAKYKLSALGGGALGDSITLLFGMDGTVVDILTGKDVRDTYYGVIQEAKKIVDTLNNEKTALKTELSVACTDGVTRKCTASADESFTVGKLVELHMDGGTITVTRLNNKTTNGLVNKAATQIGSRAFADDIEIIDVSSDGQILSIEPSRLAGCTLKPSEVLYYTLDASNAINRLILNEATGDTWHYGFLLWANNTPTEGAEENFRPSYTYVLDGETKSITSDVFYDVVGGNGLAVRYNTDGSIRSFRTIASVAISKISNWSARADNQTFELAEDVVVYLRKDSRYYLASLADLEDGNYQLTGYYDNFGCSAGGKIRVIIAAEG